MPPVAACCNNISMYYAWWPIMYVNNLISMKYIFIITSQEEVCLMTLSDIPVLRTVRLSSVPRAGPSGRQEHHHACILYCMANVHDRIRYLQSHSSSTSICMSAKYFPWSLGHSLINHPASEDLAIRIYIYISNRRTHGMGLHAYDMIMYALMAKIGH